MDSPTPINTPEPKTESFDFMPKVLIVDDKAENLYALRKVLKDTDAEIVEADNGNDALIAILNHDFSLLILDVQMPNMDGYELAELIRSEDKNRSLPIVFLSAVFSDEFHVFKGYKSGAVDFITKPFNPEILLFKVNTFLELAKQRAEIYARNEELSNSLSAINYLNNALQTKQAQLNALNEELANHNETLEMRVNERSVELYVSNRELRQANKELDLFIYRASHDLRGPVATLMGLSQVAQMESDDSVSKTYLNKIYQTADKMSGLLHKLSAVNAINGKMGEIKLIDFERLIKSVSEHFKSKLQTIEFIYEIEPNLTCVSFPRMLKIILTNLIENSLAFQNPEQQKPYIHLKIQLIENDLEIVIQDNGIGIPTKYGDKIYDMFFRGTVNSKGNGLGLYLVKKASKKIKGTVWVKSREFQFTEFHVRIPQHYEMVN